MRGHPKPFISGMTPTHMDLTHHHKAPGEPYHLNLNISGIEGGLGRSQKAPYAYKRPLAPTKIGGNFHLQEASSIG